MIRNLHVVFLLFILTACAGEQNGACISGQTSSSGGVTTVVTAGGVAQSSGEQIFQYLKEKKIVTTILTKIRNDVIGDSSASSSGAAQNMFTAFTSSAAFQSAMSAAFTLAILIYGVGVATGIIQTQLGDAIVRIGKIIFIAIVATNWTYFYNVVGGFFLNGTDEIMSYMFKSLGELYAQNLTSGTTTEYNFESMFADIDVFFATIFSVHTFAILAAMISIDGSNAGPYSNIYAIFLVMAMWQVIMGLLKVITVYAFSLFARALMFALAPIFFTFMLFNQTKHMFDAWLKLMINYSLQPVIMASFLGMFISALSSLFKEVYMLKVCFATPGGTETGWHFVGDDNARIATSAGSTPPLQLDTLMMLFFFSWMFSAYLKLAEGFSQALTQSVTGNLAEAIALSQAGKK